MTHCHGSSWGLIRNNRIFNGGTSHFMTQCVIHSTIVCLPVHLCVCTYLIELDIRLTYHPMRSCRWKQVIFENNTITGISPIAMGNSVGTGPGGGYDHHIYHHKNTIEFVWGNDREIVTFDDAVSVCLPPGLPQTRDALRLSPTVFGTFTFIEHRI